MSTLIASSSVVPGSVACTSLCVSSYTRGCSATDLDLATSSLSSTCVTIVPLTSVDRVRLLSGIYGPFRPPKPSVVPLWVAIHLKKRKKAVIVSPLWLTIDSLTDTLKYETTQANFSPLPPYWIGISHLLLTHAADDLPHSNRIRSLLKDILDARQSKIISGVSMLNSVHLQMSNISTHEIAQLRGFFTTAFSHLKALRTTSEVEAESKLQSQLDARNTWLLQPPLPDSFHHHPLHPAHSISSFPNHIPSTTPNPIHSSATTPSRLPRQSNLSDSRHHSASIPHSDSPTLIHPPRFAVDENDND
ncbi:DNA replication protein PSF2 [Mycosarcoma maydis]|uniref:DNA replication complex GINS protein PSF2 n=1 Tax=Mycosarcoma maydis TaxID=5270 RepID=A0A0D1EA40_MYCMD|nr:DNA replication protein PSF2 [Ustilago maydis 521]KIS71260.1 hypothetical protein UMAG_11652 [Ustilago maydis 521]|eukprot:XP_011387453.1 hypothetical protein UMAG_11652 [Ustilago maydis 521]